MSKSIRVILADDHALVRSTLANWLRGTSDIQVIAEVKTAEEALNECLRAPPDVLVMDIDMPGLSCFDAARTIAARCANVRIVFLSAFMHDRYIEEALSVGASGYVTKGQPPQAVTDAVHAAATGGTYFVPEVQARLVVDSTGVRLSGRPLTRISMLTPRELEVLRYIARGMSKKEIADTIHLSVKTVDNHSTSLMSKLDIHDRVELTRFAIREGLADA